MTEPDPKLLAGLRERWGDIDFSWPWLAPPCTVRILFYADFPGAFAGGSFQGLKQVVATLGFGHFFWARFEWALANRGPDPSADPDKQNKTLDQLDLNSYDQIWFFGFSGLPSILTANEVTVLKDFMDNHQGGVLVTGDHYDLGAAIASGVPRAGKMRMWPAPDSGSPDRLSTLREGVTPGWQFEDQSDDVPQPIRIRHYPLTSFRWWQRRTRPHPVLCGPNGPIKVFPDHMHEGMVVVPSTLPAAEWPSTAGLQPQPEIIAWGSVEETGLTHTGQEFGIVGAYNGHLANVGRVVADSTWHHWFDINLVGDGGVVGGSTGFNASPAGKAALRQIESYHLNVAIWLCPRAKQIAMRNRLAWGALWRDPLIMMPPEIPIVILGEFALDAFGKSAPHCTIIQWVLDLVPPPVHRQLLDVLNNPRPCPPHLEECIVGAGLRAMLAGAARLGKVPRDVNDEYVDGFMSAAFAEAVPKGLKAAMELVDESRKVVATMHASLKSKKGVAKTKTRVKKGVKKK